MAGNDDRDSALSWLQEKLPETTEEERIRFYVARKEDKEAAYEQLKNYLEFVESINATMKQVEAEVEEELRVDNTKYTSIEGNPFEDKDYKNWIISSKVAMTIKQKELDEQKKEKEPIEDDNEKKVAYDSNIILSRAFRLHKKPDEDDYCRDLEGNLIASAVLARTDLEICNNDAKAYSLALSVYLYRVSPRNSMETVTVLIDTRPGEGWPNCSAVYLVPLFKELLSMCQNTFPERLHKVVLYPLPSIMYYLWTTLKLFINDPVITGKINIISGSAKVDAYFPLQEVITENVQEVVEKDRKDAFIIDENAKKSKGWFY